MKKFLRNPWVYGIGTAVLGGLLLSLLLDWVNDVDWLSTFNIIIKYIGDVFVAVFNFEIKLWWLLIAIAVIFAALWITVEFLDAKRKSETPPFLQYTKDFVVGYSWEWSYAKGYDGKYSMSNLHPICTKCGMILKQGGSWGSEMECLRCKSSKKWDDSLLVDARLLIEDNIKNQNYLNQHN